MKTETLDTKEISMWHLQKHLKLLQDIWRLWNTTEVFVNGVKKKRSFKRQAKSEFKKFNKMYAVCCLGHSNKKVRDFALQVIDVYDYINWESLPPDFYKTDEFEPKGGELLLGDE